MIPLNIARRDEYNTTAGDNRTPHNQTSFLCPLTLNYIKQTTTG
jgi:hypothetical protein